MKNYVEENQRILVNWEQEYKKRGNDINFCPDGIMFRGSIEKDKAGKNWRHLENGKENDFWAITAITIENNKFVHENNGTRAGEELTKKVFKYMIGQGELTDEEFDWFDALN